MIAGEGSPYRRHVLEQLDLPKSTARASLGLLAANATIERRGEDYALVDPLFEQWIHGLREAGETPPATG